MSKDNPHEKSWSDLARQGRDAISFLPFFTLGGYMLATEAVEKIAAYKPKTPRYAVLTRPLVALAGAAGEIERKLSDKTALSIGVFAGAQALGVAAGLFTAVRTGSAIGFAWHALLAGKSLVAAAVALGAGTGVYAAVSAAALAAIVIVVPLILACVFKPGSVAKAAWLGWKEGRDWRRLPKQTVPAPGSQPFKYEAPEPSRLVRHLGQYIHSIEKEDSAERQRLFKTLKDKFPAEFAEAAHVPVDAPQLRRAIEVGKPLKFKSKGALQVRARRLKP